MPFRGKKREEGGGVWLGVGGLVGVDILDGMGNLWGRYGDGDRIRGKKLTVDPDGAGAEAVADADGRVEVLGVDGGGEAVLGVVAEPDGLLLGRELGDGADGPENLLLHDLHVVRDVGKDGGLDEVALVAVALAARDDGGAVLLARLDVAHDAVVLELADLGALEGLRVEGVADLVVLGAGLEGGDELVVDALLHVDARAGAAALAVVVVDAKVDPADGLLDVGVVEDDVGRLAAQLERHALEVGGRGGLHDGAADGGRAREGDLVDVHVRRDGGARDLAEARDDVDDAGGEAGLLDELGEHETGEGRLLGRLEDDGVAGGQGGADLPRQHEQGEVPRDDLTADANLEQDRHTKLANVSSCSRPILARRVPAPASCSGTCLG